MRIDTKVTLPKGYFVADTGPAKGNNLQGLAKLITKLEKANIILSAKAINVLTTLNEKDFNNIYNDTILQFKAVKGQFLRPTFASGADVADEFFTYEDFIVQINHYYITYGLGQIDEAIFETPTGRKVEIDNLRKRKEVKELNATFKIIDVKSTKEFILEVAKIINMPIVFGVQQTEFIKEAFNKGILVNCITDTIKVKENIFAILDITGKEFFKDSNILRTATDILRYAYFVSGEDYKKLPKGTKFKLKTSDKNVIMTSINKIAKRDIKNVFGDIKPYKSQWLSLSKNLFPGSKKFNRYPNAQGIFDYLRNGGNIETFNTVTQRLISEGKMLELTKHLSAKPGELLRSLDMIIRNSSKIEIDNIVSILENIKLNPKLLIQVRKWLEYRTQTAFTERTFKVKGKPVTIDNKPLTELKTKRTMKVVNALRTVMVKSLVGKELFPAPVEVEEISETKNVVA